MQQVRRLVVIAWHSTPIHVAISQIILGFGKLLTRRTLKPHGGRCIVAVGAFTIITSVSHVKLSLCIAQLSRLQINRHRLFKITQSVK